MSNLKFAVHCSLAAVLAAALVACSSSGGTAAAAGSGGETPTSTVSMPTSAAPANPLEGQWHQQFTCEENVRTFQRNLAAATLSQRRSLAKLKGNGDASVPTLLKEYTREFAWGPNAIGPIHGALAATQIKPTALCKGAPDRERTIRFQLGLLVVYDWDLSTWGGASYAVVNDHTFTVNDGGVNFGDPGARATDTFSFRIEGQTLTIALAGQDDPWAGTSLEEAPWVRMS